MLPDTDVVRLRHMLDAANEALEFTAGKNREDLDTDRMLSRAIVRDIEIVGEAATTSALLPGICCREFPGRTW